jgi:hypothetical protein
MEQRQGSFLEFTERRQIEQFSYFVFHDAVCMSPEAFRAAAPPFELNILLEIHDGHHGNHVESTFWQVASIVEQHHGESMREDFLVLAKIHSREITQEISLKLSF